MIRVEGCFYWIAIWMLSAWCFPWVVIPGTLIFLGGLIFFVLPIVIIDLATHKKR
jgi:hypothetical protein